MLSQVIAYLYFIIFLMIAQGVPFGFSPGLINPFDVFSLTVVILLTSLYANVLIRASKLPIITRLLLVVILTPVSFFIFLFLLRTIYRLIIIYPVFAETLSGLTILSGYCVIILSVIMMPNIYILDKIIAKKYFPDYSAVKIPPGWNGKMLFPVIGLITDVILPLFLLYNIVYRNPHLYILFFSTVITRIAYLMLTSKYDLKLPWASSIRMRIISFPVFCASLVVMIVTGTGNWPVG